jgi:hypothetical protein
MEFDIVIKQGDDDLSFKVRYGTTLQALLTQNGIRGQVTNMYGRTVPDGLTLRGPTTFIVLPPGNA